MKIIELKNVNKKFILHNQKGTVLNVLNNNELVKTLPLYASEDIKKVNFFKSLITSINFLIWGDV